MLFSGHEVNNDMKDLAGLAETGDENQLLKELLHTEIVNIKNAKTESDSLLAQDYLLRIRPISVEELADSGNADIEGFDSFDSNTLDKATLAVRDTSNLSFM